MSVAILLIGYGTLVELGGIMGFVKARSKPSLIAGVACGAVLTISGVLVWIGAAFGSYIGFGMTLLLCLIFGQRLAKTKAMIPSGIMLISSIAVALVLALMMW